MSSIPSISFFLSLLADGDLAGSDGAALAVAGFEAAGDGCCGWVSRLKPLAIPAVVLMLIGGAVLYFMHDTAGMKREAPPLPTLISTLPPPPPHPLVRAGARRRHASSARASSPRPTT